MHSQGSAPGSGGKGEKKRQKCSREELNRKWKKRKKQKSKRTLAHKVAAKRVTECSTGDRVSRGDGSPSDRARISSCASPF